MEKLNNLINHKYSKLILTIIGFICYLISAYANCACNYVMYTIYGVLIYIMLLASKDTTNALFFSFLEAFTVCKVRFDNGYAQMFSWFVPIIFLIAGIITNQIIYKPKLKVGKFTIGLSIYFLGVALGGMFSQTTDAYTTYFYKWWFTPIFVIAFATIMYGIIFFQSTQEGSIDKLANDSLYLTGLIILELLFFMISNKYSPLYCIKNKCVDLGWGIHNAVGMIILTSMPLSIWKAFKDLKKYWYYLLLYVLQFGILIFLVCKGGLLAAVVGTLVLVGGLIYFYKNLRKPIIITLITCIILGVIFLSVSIATNSGFAEHLNLNTLFSRTWIWESAMNVFKSNIFFGIGLVGPAGWNVSVTFPAYQYCHNTFVESLTVTGIFGFICLLYHLVEKYTRLIYKMDFKKFIFMLFFLYPGIYGMIDNSYLEITYMLYFVYGIILFESELKCDPQIKWLLHFKEKNEELENANLANN